MLVDVWVDMCMADRGLGADMSVDMHVDMCADVRADICVDM